MLSVILLFVKLSNPWKHKSSARPPRCRFSRQLIKVPPPTLPDFVLFIITTSISTKQHLQHVKYTCWEYTWSLWRKRKEKVKCKMARGGNLNLILFLSIWHRGCSLLIDLSSFYKNFWKVSMLHMLRMLYMLCMLHMLNVTHVTHRQSQPFTISKANKDTITKKKWKKSVYCFEKKCQNNFEDIWVIL